VTSIVEPGDAESTLLGRIILFLVRFLLALFASSSWRLELFAVELLQASRNSIGVPGRIFFRFSMLCWILYLCFRVQVNEAASGPFALPCTVKTIHHFPSTCPHWRIGS